jgi:Calcineurin-like phosphoesterase superfamily domain
MKLGLLTDIHEHVDNLRAALEHFRRENVDQVVVIGDIVEMGRKLDVTCALLAEARAIGVWGNHDFGLSTEPNERSRARYSADAIRFMGSLQARLDRWGCHFAHVEPWLDPNKVEDLWFFDGTPDQHRRLDRIFNAVPHRIMFAGHFHKWVLARPDGIDGWNGTTPVFLTDGRYFVVVGALCHGQYGIFDTDTQELVPFQIEPNGA